MIGKVFGKWTIIDFAGLDAYKNRLVVVKCHCGIERKVRLTVLKQGKSKSCHCADKPSTRPITVDTRSPEYSAWSHMIQRCTNTNDVAYKDYGGRGITVCTRWRIFKNFL